MNTINLIGRTTADPELRFTTGGTPVCSVRLAVNTPPRDGKDQPAMFVDVISFGALAEAISEHVGKGRQLGVSGRLQYRQWEAEDGGPGPSTRWWPTRSSSWPVPPTAAAPSRPRPTPPARSPY